MTLWAIWLLLSAVVKRLLLLVEIVIPVLGNPIRIPWVLRRGVNLSLARLDHVHKEKTRSSSAVETRVPGGERYQASEGQQQGTAPSATSGQASRSSYVPEQGTIFGCWSAE